MVQKMDKNEAAEKLKKKGFECSVESGVVMIKGHKDSQFLSSVKKELSDIGYNGSFGIRSVIAGTKQSEVIDDAVPISEVDDSLVTDEDLAGSIITDENIDHPEIDYSDDGQGTFNF